MQAISAALLLSMVDAQSHDSHDSEDADHEEESVDFPRVLKALGITTLSGCAALIGFCFILCLDPNQLGLVPVSLGFSGGVIVYLTFMNLLPESIEQLHHSTERESQSVAHLYALLSVIAGLLISLTMERVFPHSHGHGHSEHEKESEETNSSLDPRRVVQAAQSPKENKNEIQMQRESNMPRISYSVAAALILHHLPEGMAAFVALYHDMEFGILVSFALAIHDLPSGVCIALPLYLVTGSKTKPFLLCILAAFAYLFGGIIGWIIIELADQAFVDSIIGVLFGVTSGVMLFVAFIELLPTAIVSANRHRESENTPNGGSYHRDNRVYIATITAIFGGFLVMDIGNILLDEFGGHTH